MGNQQAAPPSTHLLSSLQAAAELDVSPHQVAVLASNGEINAFKVGGSFLIDPYSLRLYQQLRQGRGRPLGSAQAWAALWILSGLDASWLTYQQCRRMNTKLHEVDAATLVWTARKRASLRLFHASPADFEAIAASLVLSGKSCDRPDIFGMPENTLELEGYANEQTIGQLQNNFAFYEDVRGNVLVHTATSTPWEGSTAPLPSTRQMPVAVVAADLASSLDPREHRAGIQSLDILLQGLRRL